MVNTKFISDGFDSDNLIYGFLPFTNMSCNHFIANGFENSFLEQFNKKINNNMSIGYCDTDSYSLEHVTHMIKKIEICKDGIKILAKLLDTSRGKIVKLILSNFDKDNLPLSFYMLKDNTTINISLKPK